MAILDKIRNELALRVDSFLSPARASYIQASKRFDALENALSGLGGAYDKGQAWQVASRALLTAYEIDWLYITNPYVRRYIDIIAQDMCQNGWDVCEEGGQDLMNEENDRLFVKAKFEKAQSYRARYGGSAIFMVTTEAGATELFEPLNLKNIISLDNLIVLTPEECIPLEWEKNMRSDSFGEPTIWQISPIINGMTASLKVHTSRILKFYGQDCPKNVDARFQGFGISELESVISNIYMKTAIDQLTANIAQEFKQDVITIPDLKGLSTSDQATVMSLRLQVFAKAKGLINAILLGPDETYTTRQVPLSGFADLADVSAQALAAATGIPQAKLYGEAPGGLNTDGKSQQQNWASKISGLQEKNLRVQLGQLYDVVFSARKGTFNGVIPKKYQIEFCPIYELDEKEEAEIAKLHAETDKIRIDGGWIMPEEARTRFSTNGYQDEITIIDMSPEEFDKKMIDLKEAYNQSNQQNNSEVVP